MERTYSVGELRALIKESSNEFKAKLGDGVESAEKSINGKAYDETKKRIKPYTDGLSGKTGGEKPKYVKQDYNGTTLDHQPENADDNYRKRVKAQVKGYSSEAEMNNGIEKSGDFSDNENIYNGIKDSGEKMHKEKEDDCKKGLVGRTRPEGYFKKEQMYESVSNTKEMYDVILRDNEISDEKEAMDYLKGFYFGSCETHQEEIPAGSRFIDNYMGVSMYHTEDGFDDFYFFVEDDDNAGSRDAEYMRGFMNRVRNAQADSKLPSEMMAENRNMKTATFKRTEFLGEEHMLTRVPDDFKKDGNVFRMRDKNGSEYIVEWKGMTGKILEHKSEKKINDSFKKMKYLMEYNSKVEKTGVNERVNESNDNFIETMKRIREIANYKN